MKAMAAAGMAAALVVLCGCGASGGSGSGSNGLGGSGGSGGSATEGTGGKIGSGGAGGQGMGSGGGPAESDCALYCSKADKAGCMPSGCVDACGMSDPNCNTQLLAVTHCAATSGTVSCAMGKPEVGGCDTEVAALATCEKAAASCYAHEGDCDPTLPSTCTGGKGCYFEPNDNYMLLCESPGSSPLGGQCEFASDCAANLYCASNVCKQWCCDDTECPGGETCTFVAAGGTVQVKVCE